MPRHSRLFYKHTHHTLYIKQDCNEDLQHHAVIGSATINMFRCMQRTCTTLLIHNLRCLNSLALMKHKVVVYMLMLTISNTRTTQDTLHHSTSCSGCIAQALQQPSHEQVFGYAHNCPQYTHALHSYTHALQPPSPATHHHPHTANSHVCRCWFDTTDREWFGLLFSTAARGAATR